MIHYTWDILAMGLIVSTVFGFTAGNYACSLVHRLPRGRGILEKKPYCGNCGTMLATKDLFPVFSALLLGHKCRYCKAPIPMTHFWTEIALGVLFSACFLYFGFSEKYFLVALLGSMLVVLASIHHNEDGLVEKRVLVAVTVVAMLLRVLEDGTLFNFYMGGLYGMIAGALIWFKRIKKVGHIYVLPLPAQLMAVGGIAAGTQGFVCFLVYFLLFLLMFRLLDKLFKLEKPTTVMLPFTLAVLVPMFVPLG